MLIMSQKQRKTERENEKNLVCGRRSGGKTATGVRDILFCNDIIDFKKT